MANVKLKDKKITLWTEKEENKLGQIKKYYEKAIEGKIWAYYKQTGGNKTITNMGVSFVNTIEDCIFYINYRKLDTSIKKIVFNHKIYDVVYIDDYEGYKTDLKITAKLSESQSFENGLTDE